MRQSDHKILQSIIPADFAIFYGHFEFGAAEVLGETGDDRILVLSHQRRTVVLPW